MNFAELFYHGASSVGAAAYAHSAMLAGRASLLTRTCVICQRSLCESMCDPPTILVRSACFLRDPDEVHPNFYKRSCASTYPFYNTKGQVALLGTVFMFVSVRSLEIYLRLRRGISRILPWLLFCTAAILDSAIIPSPPEWLNAN